MIQEKTKKMLLVMLAFAFVSACAMFTDNTDVSAETTASSLSLTDESLFETDYVEGMFTITKFHQPASGQNLSTVVVPAAINGQKVRAVGASAFNGCGNLSIYLPDTLETIRDDAFNGCPLDAIGSYTYTSTGMFATVESAGAEIPFVETPTVETSSVTAASSLPSSLTWIGTHAFLNSSVKNIIFNSTNLIVGANAFENTGNLLDVTVNAGSSITEIGAYAFLNSGLHNFTVNGSIGSLGNNAFQGTANIDKFEVAPGGNINQIGDSAFETSGIHYIILQGTVSSIGSRAFASCGNILDVTVNSTTSYTLGEYAFQNAGLHSVHLSNGLSTVEKGTFEGCGNLETVLLPDSVTHIEEDAFKNVSNIKEITIGENTTVDSNAFAGAGGSTLQALANTNNASVKNLLGISVTPAPTPAPVITPAPAPSPVITPVKPVKVSAVKLKKVKAGRNRKKATLTWSKNKKASGYTIYRKVVKKGVKGKKAKKIKFRKFKNCKKKVCKLTVRLTKKATTQFYVKAFIKTKINGKTVTYYSKASNIKKVTVK